MSGIIDYLLLTIYVLLFLIVVVVGFIVMSNINDGFISALSGDPTADVALENLETYSQRMPTFWDWTIVTIIFLIWFGLVAGIYLLDNLPVFVILFILLAIITFIVTLPLANVIYDLSIDTDFQQYFDQFPISMFFINNWAILLTFFIASIIFAFVAKPRGGTQFA